MMQVTYPTSRGQAHSRQELFMKQFCFHLRLIVWKLFDISHHSQKESSKKSVLRLSVEDLYYELRATTNNYFHYPKVSALNPPERVSHPVMQQLQVLRARQPQSDLGGAARVHAGPDGSTQKRPQQLQ